MSIGIMENGQYKSLGGGGIAKCINPDNNA